MKIDKVKIGGYTICGLLAIFIIGKMVGGKKVENKIQDVEVLVQNSTYKNKLEAYKAKDKEQEKNKYAQKAKWTYEEQIQENIKEKEKEKKDIEEQQKILEEEQKRHSSIVQKKKSIKRKNTRKRSITIQNKKEAPLPAKTALQEEKERIALIELQRMERKRRKQQLLNTWGKGGQKKGSANNNTDNSFHAVVHQTQKVSNGQTVMLRTKQIIVTPIVTIPKNTLIYGLVKIEKNRLKLSVNSVRLENQIYRVNLAVYGTDAIEGIPVDLDIVKEKADSEIADELINQANSATMGLTKVVSNIGKSVYKTKEKTVTLIDNQSVYLKFKIK